MTKEDINASVSNLLVKKALLLEELDKVNKDLDIYRAGQKIFDAIASSKKEEPKKEEE